MNHLLLSVYSLIRPLITDSAYSDIRFLSKLDEKYVCI